MPVAAGQTLTMDSLQIVHLEPDDFDAERVRAELKRAGIDDSLIRLRSNEELEHAIAAGSVDLVLSELKGANCDGLRALMTAREKHVPFIFVVGDYDARRDQRSFPRACERFYLQEAFAAAPDRGAQGRGGNPNAA